MKKMVCFKSSDLRVRTNARALEIISLCFLKRFNLLRGCQNSHMFEHRITRSLIWKAV